MRITMFLIPVLSTSSHGSSVRCATNFLTNIVSVFRISLASLRIQTTVNFSLNYTDNKGTKIKTSVHGPGILHSLQDRAALSTIKPTIQWRPGIMRPERESDQMLSFNTDDKMHGALLPLPHALTPLC
jgi:hypothetical protein